MAALAARVYLGGPLDTSREYPDLVTVASVRADTKQHFVAIRSGGSNEKYFMPLPACLIAS
jgi:hypothetical protein